MSKRNVKLGQTKADNFANIDDNFAELFDNDETLEGNIQALGGRITTAEGNITTINATLPTKLDKKPDGTTNLLDSNNKIDTTYIPDSILGQLEYQGTWDASSNEDQTERTPVKGDYYICATAGSYNPVGESQTDVTYEVGDWAVFNGTTWDKVDNTDAVRMVNNQIGNVETYKGTWASGTYQKGDIVTHNSDLWLCLANNTTTSPSVSGWARMGGVHGSTYFFVIEDWEELTVSSKTYQAIPVYSTPVRVMKSVGTGVDIEADVALVEISTTSEGVTTTTLYIVVEDGYEFGGSYTLIE